MEGLLTPLVTRVVKRFIKSADGKTNLRVLISGGHIVLRNLELNLEGAAKGPASLASED